MTRLRALIVSVIVTAGGLAWAGHGAPASSPPAPEPAVQKKGRPRLPGQADGATWTLTATNRNGDQVLKFDIRMEDLVVYDPKTGDVIGKSEPLPNNDRARLILNDKSPFPTTIVIRQENRVWTGRTDYKGQDWTVVLRRLTR